MSAGPPPAPPELEWYAVYTRSRFEKRVVNVLQESDIFTFLPLLQRMHRWSDRWSKVEVPAFTCYVFVRIAATAEIRDRVLRTPGVLGFAGREGVGTAIPDGQIENLRTVFREKNSVHGAPFRGRRQARAHRGGSLDGIEAIMISHNQGQSLLLSVGVLGRCLSIRAEGYDVEPIWSGPPILGPSTSSKHEILHER